MGLGQEALAELPRQRNEARGLGGANREAQVENLSIVATNGGNSKSV